MLSILGTVIGFLGSILPQLFKMWQQKTDQKHELAVLELQSKTQVATGQQQIDIAGINADIAERQALSQPVQVQTAIFSGNKAIDFLIGIMNAVSMFLNQTVRPIITYCFFFQYALIKYAQYTIIRTTQAAPWSDAMVKMWTDADMAIFCTIIGFWFGNRAMEKFFGKTNASYFASRLKFN